MISFDWKRKAKVSQEYVDDKKDNPKSPQNSRKTFLSKPLPSSCVSNGPLPSTVSLWSVNDVSTWLTEKDMKSYVRAFRINGIDGETLLMMDSRDLRILGVQENEIDGFISFIRENKRKERKLEMGPKKERENESNEDKKEDEPVKKSFLRRNPFLRQTSIAFKAHSDSCVTPLFGDPISAIHSNPSPTPFSLSPPPSLPIKIVFCSNVYLFTLSPSETIESFLLKLKKEFGSNEITFFDDEGEEVKMKKDEHYQRVYSMALRAQEEEKIMKLFVI